MRVSTNQASATGGQTGAVRVLYCENNRDGTVGGSHYCLLHLVGGLDRGRFDPIVIFHERHPLVSRFEQNCPTLILPPPTTVPRRPGGSSISEKLKTVRRFVAQIRERYRFLREHRIQLINLNNSVTRQQDWMVAALMAGIPCLTHERGLNARYSLLDRWLARRLALVIPVSRWVRDHMVRGGIDPANLRVLYDGLNPGAVVPRRAAAAIREEYGIRPGQPIVGIVGNVRTWKGQAVVIRALIEVARTHPDVVCFVVGASTEADAAYMTMLQDEITAAGIGAHVRFTGYQADPASFMAAMQFVLHASIEPEPYGMVLLEAMALRKAVVASRAGGPVELVEEGVTGLTFPPGDAPALAQQIRTLLDDPPLAARMGEAGRARLEREFSLDRYVADVQEAYAAILDGRPVPSHVGAQPTVSATSAGMSAGMSA